MNLKKRVAGDRQLAANRKNAQSSTGPKTAAGKSVSSRNATTHGMCATTFVLSNEDLDDYLQVRDQYMQRFGPRDQTEVDLIDRMVHATWSLRRCWTVQNQTVNMRMLHMQPALAEEYADLPPSGHTAAAMEDLAKENVLALHFRYETAMTTQYQRALKSLLDTRRNYPLAPPGSCPQYPAFHQPEPHHPEPAAAPDPGPAEPLEPEIPPAMPSPASSLAVTGPYYQTNPIPISNAPRHPQIHSSAVDSLPRLAAPQASWHAPAETLPLSRNPIAGRTST